MSSHIAEHESPCVALFDCRGWSPVWSLLGVISTGRRNTDIIKIWVRPPAHTKLSLLA